MAKIRLLSIALIFCACLVSFFFYIYSYLVPASKQRNTCTQNLQHDFITEAYFSDLFLKEGFGYTMLGARPMAFEARLLPPTPFQHEAQKVICDTPHFLMKETESDSSFKIVILIHKSQFITTINQNKDIFQEILGPETTGEGLLEKIRNSTKDIFSILHCDHTLMGILLGFGRENSTLFSRKIAIAPKGSFLSSMYYEPSYWQPILRSSFKKRSFSLIPIQPSSGFTALADERQWIQEQFAYRFCKPEDWRAYNLILPLAFCTKQSTETDELVKKYTLCKQILYDLFYDRNTVDVVMRELFTQQPTNWQEYAEQNGLQYK